MGAAAKFHQVSHGLICIPFEFQGCSEIGCHLHAREDESQLDFCDDDRIVDWVMPAIDSVALAR